MIRPLLFAGLFVHSASAVPVSDNDMLEASQTYGFLNRDVAVGGGALTIAGKPHATGVGTHAVSEIPLAVPDGANRFRGAAGVDDSAGVGKGSVRFRILSGSAVLWESPVMKSGEPAAVFDVPIGAERKLYLIADDEGDNRFDHADWVDLAWTEAKSPAPEKPRQFPGATFGLVSNIPDDQSPAMRKAIDALRKAPGSTLTLEKGDYHFHAAGALKRHFHISNHDQPVWQPVSVPLVDLHGARINGQESRFLFHGEVQPILVQDSDNVTLSGISIDYPIPHHSQGVITKVEAGAYEITIDPALFPHKLRNGWFVFRGEGWEARDGGSGIVFDGSTRAIVAGTADFNYRGVATPLTTSSYRVAKDLTKSGIKAGDVITFRQGWQRPHPAITLYRAKNTKLEDVVIHSSHGMGLLAQRSENIHLLRGGVYPAPQSGRYFSTGADATHFSNCKGLILAENGRYEGMMDDAINVHATCLRIEAKPDDRTLELKYVHPQSVGFETILPGETIQLIQAKWLTPRDPRKVTTVRKTGTDTLVITLDAPVPADLGVGDAVENTDWFPAVTFRGNQVRNNRARGMLVTTPKPILIESNRFEDIAGSAILLAGDANGWYESGVCHDVVIHDNLFRNNLTSRFQFTEALLSFYPEVPDLKGQREFYHRNIRIESNTFETFDVPLLFAISTDGITFQRNKITYNESNPSWNLPPFILKKCQNVSINGNTVTKGGRPVSWSASDVKSSLSPRQTIRVN